MEDKSVTKRRVINKEESSDDWPIFTADIKLGTNSYTEATNYIKILNKISKQESKRIVEGVPSTSSQFSETNVQTISSSLSDNVKPVSNPTSEQELTGSEECQEETKDKDSLPKAKRYFTRLTSKMSSPADSVSVDLTVGNKSLETSSCKKRKIKSSKDRVQYNQKQDFTDDNSRRQTLQEVLGDDYKEKIDILYEEYRKCCRLLPMIYHETLQHFKILKELKKISDGGNEGQEGTSIKKKNVTWSGIQNNDDDMDVTEEDNNIESTNTNPSHKIRGQARKFTLPPEYDPEDSKWTLKHREYKEGLVELTPTSHIYVNAIKLRNCKRISKDSKTLARMLLLEVFRESALSVCSLTGKKANAFDLTGTTVRPGLDEHARNVLLNFVEQHANDQKWVYWDRPSILNSLRNKMQEMRGKHK